MIYGSDPDSKSKLAARLAEKAGLPRDHAHKFLDALADVMSEKEEEQFPYTHQITIPLVEREDGSMIVDRSGYSGWWPFPTKKTPTPTTPSIPTPTKRRGPFPGRYPGPSVSIRVDDWLGEELTLDEHALSRLRKALAEDRDPGRFGRVYGLTDREKLDEK